MEEEILDISDKYYAMEVTNRVDSRIHAVYSSSDTLRIEIQVTKNDSTSRR